MPKLRDGSEVADPRLARIPFFDVRSLGYAIADLFDKDEPLRSYTWKCRQVLNQGSEGACVGFSMAHELIAQPKVIEGIDDTFALERIYWEAQKIDKWDGGAYPGAEPKMDGSSVLAGIKVLKALGYIDEYRWAFSIHDLAMAVGHMGPAILGIPWYEGMFDVWPCRHIHVDGQVAGGHAILCNGVNVKRKTFRLHNSWGSAWGNGGDCLVSWDEMDRLLHEQGEAVIPLSRTIPV